MVSSFSVGHFSILALAIFGVVPGVLFVLVYCGYLKIRFFHAFLMGFAGMAAAIGTLVATEGRVLRPSHISEDELFACIAWVLMVMTGLGLLAKVYRAWILDVATPAEREPNSTGIRAWLSVGNLVFCALFVASAYLARGWNPVATLAAVIGLLLAYPLVNCVLKGGELPMKNDSEELAEERRLVLAMVEAGKISGEDGAELIGALGQSRVTASDKGLSLSGNRRVMMLGAALVAVGFCLPWFTINIGAEARDMMNGFQQAMPGWNGAMAALPTVQSSPVVSVSGGDIQHGLGWIILALAAVVSLMPLVWVPRRENRDQHRAAALGGMIGGTVLVMYLAAGAYRSIDIGMVLVVAGYVVMWVGAAREYLRPARIGVVAVR
jgi:hypothetical protein